MVMKSSGGVAQTSGKRHFNKPDNEDNEPAASSGGWVPKPPHEALTRAIGLPGMEEADKQSQLVIGSQRETAKKKQSRVCAQCGKSTHDGVAMQACAGCNAVAYCGQACQRSYWPLHKRDCKSGGFGWRIVSRGL